MSAQMTAPIAPGHDAAPAEWDAYNTTLVEQHVRPDRFDAVEVYDGDGELEGYRLIHRTHREVHGPVRASRSSAWSDLSSMTCIGRPEGEGLANRYRYDGD